MPGVAVGYVDRERNRIIGAVLRELREDAGLSASDVAGIGSSVLTAWERGERTVRLDRLVDVARAYRVDVRLLLAVIETRIHLAEIV